MAELRPWPFALLLRRMMLERERTDQLFDLPSRRFVTGAPGFDLSVRFHGRPASSPIGPAAGPHTQMAQNLVLGYLAGARIFELKTVQVRDDLLIPRPCIDMQTIGYNAEWSQELRLHESLEEYVKGAMLIAILTEGAALAPASRRDLFAATTPAPDFAEVLYDLSVGYDLAGIRGDGVQGFIRGMLDARSTVERLRAEIPSEYEFLREIDYPTRIADTVTLSTFHGCPPDEIERILAFLMRENGLHGVVKFNPTLLGPAAVRGILYDELGYHDVRIPDSAFTRDTTWDQATEMVERLGGLAGSLGLGFGVKFSNTLIVENTRGFLPAAEKEVYLSGAPLHVLAMHLVARFRERFGDRFPISFAAGIDARNVADAAALGLVPVTVCSDLLKPQGYGRLQGYYRELVRRMREVGAATLDAWILSAYGNAEEALRRAGVGAGDPRYATCLAGMRAGDALAVAGPALHERWISEAKLLNTQHYVASLAHEPRYARVETAKPPKKIGRRLELFDCLTCDKCIPVCPNDANFDFPSVVREIPVVKLVRDGATWIAHQGGKMTLREERQIASFADFCNECGNCDVFCPEDGGPYILKPRFFGSEEDWRRFGDRDGFFVTRDAMLGRIEGREYRLGFAGAMVDFEGEGSHARFSIDRPEDGTVVHAAAGVDTIDLTLALLMNVIRRGVLDPGRVNPVSVPIGSAT